MKDYLRFAANSIKHRKLRSWLTIVGIIIGIGAIVALISVSQGLENAVTEQFEKIGSNRIFLIPKGLQEGSYMTSPFTDKDVEIIQSVPGIDWTNPFISITGQVEYGNEKKFSEYIRGVETQDLEMKFADYDISLIDGRYLRQGDKYDLMLGYSAAKELFDKEISANNRITIQDTKFKVVGIFEKIGTEDDDYSIYTPMETIRNLFNKGEEISMVDIQLKEGLDVNAVAEKVERRLERHRDKEDFIVMTPDQILRQFSQILNIIQVVLGGIAAISLLVGAVGIMNSMYTNVLERTKEIGIMKSVGATNKTIMLIFLTEAALIGLIGGVLGAAFGSLLSYAVGEIAKSQGFLLLKIQIEWTLLFFGISFAVIVGGLSGLLPAKQASKLRIVEAIGY